MSEFHPTDRVAIITGAARGIGWGIAQHLGQQGFKLVLVDVDEALLRRQAQALNGELRIMAGDVARQTTGAEAVDAALAGFGKLDGLVNNAGISNPVSGPLEDLPLARWQRYLDVNLTGAMLCTRACVKALRASRGAVVNVTSTRASQSEAHCEAYAAAKGGLLAFTHASAISLGPDVRVNAVAPGWIDTEGPTYDGTSDRHRAEDHAQHPTGRIGTPKDVAEAVEFLLSERSRFMTGQQVVVDGGMTKRMIYRH